MKEQLETLKKWVQTGQVKTARGRSEDDLLTLIGKMEVALRKQPGIKSVCHCDERDRVEQDGELYCVKCGSKWD